MKDMEVTYIKYNSRNKCVGEFTSTLSELRKSDKKYSNFTYILSNFDDTSILEKDRFIEHYGVKVKGKGNFKFNESDYLNIALNKKIICDTKYHPTFYWLLELYRRIECMKFNSSHLNHDDFNNELDTFLKVNPEFIEVNDLNSIKGIPGNYLLVFDGYCKVHIGAANDPKRKIMAEWSNKDFYSGIGSKLFLVKDTTGIFFYPNDDPWKFNYKHTFYSKYCSFHLPYRFNVERYNRYVNRKLDELDKQWLDYWDSIAEKEIDSLFIKKTTN